MHALPQLFGEVSLAHAVSHRCWPAGHAHMPALHVAPIAQSVAVQQLASAIQASLQVFVPAAHVAALPDWPAVPAPAPAASEPEAPGAPATPAVPFAPEAPAVTPEVSPAVPPEFGCGCPLPATGTDAPPLAAADPVFGLPPLPPTAAPPPPSAARLGSTDTGSLELEASEPASTMAFVTGRLVQAHPSITRSETEPNR